MPVLRLRAVRPGAAPPEQGDDDRGEIPERTSPLWLSYLDSNQERQNQNLLCYRYTIAQSSARKRLQRYIKIQNIQFFDEKMVSGGDRISFFSILAGNPARNECGVNGSFLAVGRPVPYVRCRPCVGFAVRRRFRKTAFAVLWKVRGGKAVSGSGRLGMVSGNEGWAGKRGGRPGGARLRAKPQDAAVCVRRPRSPPFGCFPQTGCSAGHDPGSAGRSSHCVRHAVTAGRMGRISYMECL